MDEGHILPSLSDLPGRKADKRGARGWFRIDALHASAASRGRAMRHGCRARESEGEDSSGARFGAKGEHLTGRVPAKRAHRASIAFPYQNKRVIVDAHKFHGAIGIADRHDRVARMTVDNAHAGFGAREHFRLASHRAILAVERPQDELLGA